MVWSSYVLTGCLALCLWVAIVVVLRSSSHASGAAFVAEHTLPVDFFGPVPPLLDDAEKKWGNTQEQTVGVVKETTREKIVGEFLNVQTVAFCHCWGCGFRV